MIHSEISKTKEPLFEVIQTRSTILRRRKTKRYIHALTDGQTNRQADRQVTLLGGGGLKTKHEPDKQNKNKQGHE